MFSRFRSSLNRTSDDHVITAQRISGFYDCLSACFMYHVSLTLMPLSTKCPFQTIIADSELILFTSFIDIKLDNVKYSAICVFTIVLGSLTFWKTVVAHRAAVVSWTSGLAFGHLLIRRRGAEAQSLKNKSLGCR